MARRQSQDKKKAAELWIEIEMRQVEINVRGTKRKVLQKETAEEKADKGRAAKKRMIDSIWLAGGRKTESDAGVSKKARQGPPGRNRVKEAEKVKLVKDSQKANSRLSKMWASQTKTGLCLQLIQTCQVLRGRSLTPRTE